MTWVRLSSVGYWPPSPKPPPTAQDDADYEWVIPPLWPLRIAHIGGIAALNISGHLPRLTTVKAIVLLAVRSVVVEKEPII